MEQPIGDRQGVLLTVHAGGLAEAARGFLGYLAGYRRLSSATIRAYRTDLTMVLGWLRLSLRREPIPADLTRQSLLRFLGTLNGSSPATIERRLYAITSFCSWLVDSGDLPTNPARGLPRPRRTRLIPRSLPVEHVQGLLLAVRDMPLEKCLLWLFLGTGMRRAEVVGVCLEDMDLPHRTLIVHGKGSRERQVPLSEDVAAAILAYLPYRRPRRATSSLLLNAWRDPLTAHCAWRTVKRLARLAGLDERQVHPHKLRRTFATLSVRSGTDIRTIQELLGHANLNTTALYVEVGAAQKAEAVERLAEGLALVK